MAVVESVKKGSGWFSPGQPVAIELKTAKGQHNSIILTVYDASGSPDAIKQATFATTLNASVTPVLDVVYALRSLADCLEEHLHQGSEQ